ncbi:hypothetical protein NEIELOOT_00196, partial [Neisseria elongata subsp. glycolytica ATCC 29315]
RAAGQGGVARALPPWVSAPMMPQAAAPPSPYMAVCWFLCAVGVGDAAAEHQGGGNGDDSNRVEQFHDCPFCRVWKY